ncbi:uncharacterized protein LOC100184902 [Ciona intestinalis]
MATKNILQNINAQWKENDNRSPSRKRRLDDVTEESQLPTTTKRRHLQTNTKVVNSTGLKQGLTNAKMPINAKNKSIKNFFSDIPRVSCTKSEKIQIFKEAKKTPKKNATTQTRSEAEELVCSDQPSEKYWELLAEERRKGLHEALEENKELADEIVKKDEIIEEMKSEIERLEETASHAQYLASVIEQIGKGCLDETGSEDDLSQADVASEQEESTKDLSSPNQPQPIDEEKSNDATDAVQSSDHDSDKENKPEDTE